MIHRIEVTEEHIKSGVRGDSDRCPIGLAVKETFPGSSYGVCRLHIRVGSFGHDSNIYETNGFVEDFVNRFDFGNTVRPFTLVLDSDNGIAYND